jgi:V8-like Glu-specific endopeptidase
VFPYRAIGRLFASLPGLGDFACSAFVIERRVLATAGHCVFDFVGGRGRAARDFLFIPGFDRGRAPFGTWNGNWARPAPSWRQGDGSVPSVADFGVITVADRQTSRGPVVLGDVVGVLGWQLQVDIDQATLLGYPGNLDGAQRMQQTDAAVSDVIPPNAIEFGSAQGGGASGGPIAEDFGQPAAGQPQTANRVVSVVSFGTDGLWTLGGSVLNSEFADLIDRACRRRAGNCAD